MELVTGRAGSPHITSQQDRQKHQGIWGDGAYILATGNQLEPQVQSSNKILIKDGALMFQGALFSVKVGTTDEITINNGNQGMQRKDLVVARYKYDSSRNIESAEWTVIQGTPAASNPVAPAGTSGNMQDGDATVDCPFMIVNLDGINVTGVDIIPEKIATLPEFIGNLPRFSLSETVSTSYTPKIDGFLTINYMPADASNIILISTTDIEASLTVGTGLSQSGTRVAYTIPVVAGRTYRTDRSIARGTLTCRFMPLH